LTTPTNRFQEARIGMMQKDWANSGMPRFLARSAGD
jgi:hypothetical protein